MMLLRPAILAVLSIIWWGAHAQCVGDFNEDGAVNMLDLVYMLDNYGFCVRFPCYADITSDNFVTANQDVDLLLKLWGFCDSSGGTTRPDATYPTTTLPATTTPTQAPTSRPTTTRTTFAQATTAGRTTTTARTTLARTTLPPGVTTQRPTDAIDLSFDPIIAPDCQTVQPGAVLAYWAGEDRDVHGNCIGRPSFLVQPTAAQGYCFQIEYTNFDVGTMTDMMFLSCTVGRDAFCGWNAVYEPGFSLLDAGIQYGCTTGSPFGAPTATWNGTTLPSIQPTQPIITGNEMHHINLVTPVDAPFALGDCLKPTAYPSTANVPFRSYMPFCRFEDLPVEWQTGIPFAGAQFKLS